MMIRTLVSIIIPVYNGEKWLARCIDSILDQSFYDFEVLLVDDGSTDNTFYICSGYSFRDTRIKAYSQDNSGVTSARKLGWEKSTGEWIMFVDADDYLPKDSIQYLVDTAVEENCDIVNASFVSTGTGRVWEHKDLGKMTSQQYLESLIFGKTYGVVYASIYKRKVISELAFCIPRSIKIGEDFLMNVIIAENSSFVVNTDKLVYSYFDNGDSVMNTKIKHPSYILSFYDMILNLVKNNESFFSFKEHLIMNRNTELVRSLFSYEIKYSKELFILIREKLKEEVKHSRGSFKMEILRQIAINGALTYLTKELIGIFEWFRGKLKGNNRINRDIIHLV